MVYKTSSYKVEHMFDDQKTEHANVLRYDKATGNLMAGNKHHDTQILLNIQKELYNAAKAQPCPACRADIEHFAEFFSIKIAEAGSSKEQNRRLHMKKLKEVDYINELTDIAMFVTKVIRPISKNAKVPEVYEKVLKEDLEGNRNVKKHLIKVKKLMGALDKSDKDLALMRDIIDSFIKVTEFKLSIDPITFYIFDKTVRLGYKTHVLSATSKLIIGVKSMINPSRYV